MQTPNIRYIVRDVDEAVDFYTQHLGFSLVFRPAPGFAILERQGLRMALNAVGGPGGASQPMPDGRQPEPGGWNRIMLESTNLEAQVEALRSAGVALRNDIVHGIGGNQILVEDPSGNPIELFELRRQADAQS